MRIPVPRRSRRAAGAVAAFAAASLAIVGLQLPTAAPASAAPAAPTVPAAPAKGPDVVRQCAAPQPGQFACLALRRTDVPARHGIQPHAATPDGFGATDLQSAYALPPDGGAGQTVAIVDAYDDPTAEADLAVYRAQYGLPPCTTDNGCFSKVSQRGGADLPDPDPDWSGEISLDLDMVSAAAPLAHILLVEADTATAGDLGAAVDQAVALGAKYVSNSYGTSYDSTPGSGEDPSELTALDPHYDHPGVAVVASSGDDGYGVSYPAASQYVTAVGGTSLIRDSSDRGWSESVWNNAYGAPGSGCSAYEPKPAFQSGAVPDSVCGMRAVADVAAVADPVTGVAVYQTYGNDGWAVYGGTSASAPLVAGVYAAAGTPAAGTYPNAYPYAKPGALNDVTSGDDGSCATAALCTAGPGYDGPTGLGTPHGLAAFTSGPHGVLTGAVTDRATGAALAGAKVTAGDASATTDADGTYTLDAPPGTYDVTAAAYGYRTGTATGVQVTDGGTATASFALDAVPTRTVTGTVTDGSGHGWPLYATITAQGVPGGAVHTNPATGRYTLTLPQDATYTLHVTADYPGYLPVDKTVKVGEADRSLHVAVPVDTTRTDAPGYTVHLDGATEPFTSTTEAPQGWSVADAEGTTGGWTFDDPGARGNRTGGSGGFAVVDSDEIGQGLSQDTSLLSPSYDLTGVADPLLAFDTDYRPFGDSAASADVSTDGGATWTSLWQQTTETVSGRHVEIPLDAYAGSSDLRLRFHYTGSWAYWWQLDNVFVGRRAFDPVPGGLVVGVVKDANTKQGVTGATVTSADHPDDHATTVATPDDPHLRDGFYWFFSHLTGKHKVSADASRYTSATAAAAIPADGTVRRNLTLKAGRVKVTPGTVDKTAAWGHSTTQVLTVKNTGTAPATVTLGETPGGFTMQKAGAPLNLVKGHYTPYALAAKGAALGSTAVKGGQAGKAANGTSDAPSGDAWTPVPDLPVSVGDNSVFTYHGTVYSAFGYTGLVDTSDLYAYDADSGTWTKLASAADTREAASHGVIGDRLYAVGGWGADGAPDATLEVYDIATDTWTTGASSPKPYAGAGSAVLGGTLYSVGGCTETVCGTADVTAYDAASDTWTQLADYPEPVAWESCGGIAGKLYCAGGTTDAGSITHGYVYDPAADSWSPIADQPTDAWGAAYTAANGLLLVRGGAVDDGGAVTNQTWAYRPADNTWSALPSSNASLYRGGGSVGFYAVGGLSGRDPVKTAEVLAGYDQPDSTDVDWLSESATTATLAPGASTTVTLTLDASAPDITQPGTLTAQLGVTSDTPYANPAVGVTFTVKPPATWGKITGTVDSGGTPLAGATVQINTWATHYTLKTAKDGTYALWLDVRNNPLQLIVAKDGYQPTTAKVRIKKGATTTRDFTLLPD